MLTAYSVTSHNRADGLVWETDVLSKAGRLIPVIKNCYAMCRNSYRALDLRLKDRRFDPRLFHKLFAYVYLCHKPAKFGTGQGAVMPAAGKVTVGLASHWPCVIDFSGLSTYGLTA